MSDHILENNEVQVIGKAVTETVFSHKVYGEGFYNFNIEIPRLFELLLFRNRWT